jgi:predicted nucleotidyltransferase
MPSVFTERQSSRFLDLEAARAELRTCAGRLMEDGDAVIAVHLFGSLATGTATPRSDADIVVEVAPGTDEEAVHDRALRVFADAPLPAELFVRSSEALASETGIAGAVAREGQRLA